MDFHRKHPISISLILFSSVLVLACTACAGCTDIPTVTVVPFNNTSDATLPETEIEVVECATVEYILPVPETRYTVTQGGYFPITVTAPYGDYHISVSRGGIIPDGQPGVDTTTPPYTQNYAKIHIGTSGTLTFSVQSVSTDDITVRLLED